MKTALKHQIDEILSIPEDYPHQQRERIRDLIINEAVRVAG